uniref:hypothetical protein n=1 Tax=Halomonas sp. EAR18 TaxID=2518972 RepID=UPI001B352078
MFDSHLAKEPQAETPPRPMPFRAAPDGDPLEIVGDARSLTARDPQGHACGWWSLEHTAQGVVLDWAGACAREPGEKETLAAIEAVFAGQPHIQALNLAPALARLPGLVRSGLVPRRPDVPPRVTQEAFFQQPRL